MSDLVEKKPEEFEEKEEEKKEITPEHREKRKELFKWFQEYKERNKHARGIDKLPIPINEDLEFEGSQKLSLK
jgi:hypothetical protein